MDSLQDISASSRCHGAVLMPQSTVPMLNLGIIGVALRSPDIGERSLKGSQPLQCNEGKCLYFEQAKEHVDTLEDPFRLHGVRSPTRIGAPMNYKRNSVTSDERPTTATTPISKAVSMKQSPARHTSSSPCVKAFPKRLPPSKQTLEKLYSMGTAGITSVSQQLEKLRQEQIRLELNKDAEGAANVKNKVREYGRVKRKQEPQKSELNVAELLARTDVLLADETYADLDVSDADDDDSTTSHQPCGLDFLPLFRIKQDTPDIITVKATDYMSDTSVSHTDAPKRTLDHTAPIDERYLHHIFASASPAHPSATTRVETLRPKAPHVSEPRFRPLPRLVNEDPALVYAIADWSLRRLQEEAQSFS